jgi:dipeptidyl aminopeptidase/acylaminoacyl peptidase
MQEQKKPIQNRMALFDLSSGDEEIIEQVASFSFSDDGRYLSMRGYGAQGQTGRGVDLIVRNLATDTNTNFGNVAASAWQDEGTLLALAIETGSGTGNGIQLYDPASGIFRTLDSSDSKYVGLTWREESADLAVLRAEESEEYEDGSHSIVAFRRLDTPRFEKHLYEHQEDDQFPADMRIVDFRQLSWSDDGSMLFFGIKEWEKKPEKPEPDTTEAEEERTREAPPKEEEEEPANVEVWHAGDVDIMPEQKVRANQNRRRNYLSVLHLDSLRFVQLGNELTEDVSLVEGQRLAMGTDQTPYETERMFGPVYNDYYVIDTATGSRTKILDRLQYGFGPSTGGNYYVYLKDDHYYVYDFKKGTHTNITEGVPTTFVNVEDDHTVEQKPPFRFAGWTKDDRSILLYDKFDIWEIRPDGSRATNITNGAEEQIRYRFVRLDREEDYIDPAQPFFMSLYGDWSKQYGYARMARLGREPERLLLEDLNVGRLTKAEDAEVYAFTRQDFDDSPDYFVGGASLADAKQITNTNAFQDEYAWGRSELVEFTNAHGKLMQGALYYPAGYEAGT